MSIQKNWRDQFKNVSGAQLDTIIAKAPLTCIWQTCSHVSSGNWADGCLAVQERKCREIARQIVLDGCRDKPAKGGT